MGKVYQFYYGLATTLDVLDIPILLGVSLNIGVARHSNLIRGQLYNWGAWAHNFLMGHGVRGRAYEGGWHGEAWVA